MNIKLHYYESGKGFPLILLHGNGEDYHYFEHQTAYFSKQYRVIAIDTRGHGNSPRGTKPFTIEQFADDLLDFMNQHQIVRANILGFSDGANIAIIFALKHSDRINKLILNAGNLFPKGMKNSVRFWVWRHDLKAKWQHNTSQHELMTLMRFQPNITPAELKNIIVPTLIIVGNKDMIIEKHSILIHKNIAYSQLNIIKGNHFCARENYVDFNRVVEHFLNK